MTIDVEVALKASEVYMELSELSRRLKLRTPNLADAIVYSILLKGDKLVTGDRLFRNVDNVIYIGD